MLYFFPNYWSDDNWYDLLPFGSQILFKLCRFNYVTASFAVVSVCAIMLNVIIKWEMLLEVSMDPLTIKNQVILSCFQIQYYAFSIHTLCGRIYEKKLLFSQSDGIIQRLISWTVLKLILWVKHKCIPRPLAVNWGRLDFYTKEIFKSFWLV